MSSSPPPSPLGNLSSLLSQPTALSLAFTLASVELPLHSVVVAVCLLNLTVLSSTRILHPNLRFILISQSTGIGCFETVRLCIVWQKFFSQNMFNPGSMIFQVNIRGFDFFRLFIPHIIMLERFMASFLINGYEDWRKPYLALCCCSILAILSVYNGISQPQSWSMSIYNTLAPLISWAMSVFEILIFLIIRVTNLKRYDGILLAKGTATKQYSLSEKYQLSENIRTSRQLLPAFLCHFFSSLDSLIIYGAGYYQLLLATPQLYSLFFAITCLLTGVFCLGIELTVITHHPLLKKQALSLLKKLRLGRRNRALNAIVPAAMQATSNSHQPTDIRGDPLIRRQDADVYFRMLQDGWQ